MTIAMDYRYNAMKQYSRQRDNISAHLALLSMWAVVGLVLTGVTFACGFGTQVVQALATAG